ncbi:hypothetical protein Psta_0342 [Pirellula staleyi DSM 6068]|uniref:Uncharacterized protein n=1 Tax=Pirellula staleyi (strain ATCC 27377 / DSM 6068 / ICPB 4128) TaxID=530564 RepID=D2R2C3_PIRSD|nr:hypothetical protein [Pirellula staleyi]ADB15032.1 hypothetical protein Psta_0342 [Pirellula staleyi DSM 6068]
MAPEDEKARIASIEEFFEDNGFSDKAAAKNTFIKHIKKKCGKVGAHIKVEFATKDLERFTIHGTVRLKEDASKLARTSDEEAVGRAIWVYSNKTCRSPQEWKWWFKEGDVTFQELKKFCRVLAAEVAEWEYEIEKLKDCICKTTKGATKISSIA